MNPAQPEPYATAHEHVRDLLEPLRMALAHRAHVQVEARSQVYGDAGEGVVDAMTFAFLMDNVEAHRVALPKELSLALRRGQTHVAAREAATVASGAGAVLRWNALATRLELRPGDQQLLLAALAPHVSTGFVHAYRRLLDMSDDGAIPTRRLADVVAREDGTRWEAAAALHPDERLIRSGALVLVGAGSAFGTLPGVARVWASPVVVDFLLRDGTLADRPGCLGGLARLLAEERGGDADPPWPSEVARHIDALAADLFAVDPGAKPLVAVVTSEGLAPLSVAAQVARRGARRVLVLSSISTGRTAESAVAYRQAALLARLEGLVLVAPVPADLASPGALRHLIEETRGAPLLLVSEQPLEALSEIEGVRMRHVRVPPLGETERRWLWHRSLGDGGISAETLAELAASFALQESEIRAVARHVAAEPSDDGPPTFNVLAREARRRLSRGLEGVAERLETRATADDLIVSATCRAELDGLGEYVRFLREVEARHDIVTTRGRGTSALFHGPSGTGKTFAAAVVARAGHRDLFRIDLAQVVDKYIGETEKKLDRVFTLAEASDSVILFDEADSLFSKRGNVSSSNDRYANMQVNFLLQRMESYRGMSILTTNLLESIDEAFRRRIQFTIHFAKPDYDERLRLWRLYLAKVGSPAIPDDVVEQAADVFDMTGAHIRSAVIKAAVAGASRGGPITARILVEAATGEYRALGGLVRSVEWDGLDD